MVSSEPDWDFLEFSLNGRVLKRWSGNVPWQPYSFPVPSGINTFEWKYIKDSNFSLGLNAAFIDNVVLPLEANGPGAGFQFDLFPAALSIRRTADGQVHLRLVGLADTRYLIEVSTHLVKWATLSVTTSKTGIIEFTDVQSLTVPFRFYRVTVAP